MSKAHRVVIDNTRNPKSRIFLYFQPRTYFRCNLGTEVQERLRPPRRTDELLESPCHHLVEHFEERDEVAFAGPIRTDQDVQRAQFKVHRLDGLEALEDHSSQGSQVSVS